MNTSSNLTPARLALAKIAVENNSVFRQLFVKTRDAFRGVWRNPDPELTPEVMVAEMGTKAVDNFTAHAIAVQLLAAVGMPLPAADSVPPKDKPYTANKDGTITLN